MKYAKDGDFMRKLQALLFFYFSFYSIAVAQLQSPDVFLGYELGTRFTPHYKLVAYFEHVAAQSKMVKLQEYGKTNEQRPLLVAYIASEQHISGLESIREQNIRVSEGKASFSAAQPVIVWLSYNVHGNEPTSSEAAMQTLFELVAPSGSLAKEWLKNTIVIMDPCLNPDGRDRFVNWYNAIVGKKYDVTPYSREHREPWPQGRTNHYNFDLNRDWAWQTQTESRQRVALYNHWLPQIHVDYHEQGYNEPYYFAPAAEPLHDVITTFQRTFQDTIGKNHSRYFDRKGWLYFTKERFDLFYPSYGDTYPIYNGAIGMTYEQGGIGGGLGVVNRDEDTLTFVERIAHHVTTGLSTVEVASTHAQKILKEYQNYFVDAVAGKYDTYKSYVVKHSAADALRIASLRELLDKNQIRYGKGSGIFKGYNYATKKEESFSLTDKDLVIGTQQPKGAMVRVLFEPESRLADSVTYDITAWALPYVYGVNAYATKSPIRITDIAANRVKNELKDAYGYVFSWSGIASIKMMTYLLQRGVKLRVAERPFVFKGKTYSAGSIIILKTSNSNVREPLRAILQQAGDLYQVPVEEFETGMVDAGLDFGSEGVWALKRPKVVLLSGPSVSQYAAGEVWNFFDNIIDYPLTIVNTEDIGRIDWSKTDVLIMPHGNYPFISNKPATDMLLNWIRNGGRLITLEGATAQIAKQEWSALKQKILNVDSTDPNKVEKSNFANREREYVAKGTPGAIFKVEVDNTHPLMFGYPDYYYTLKQDTLVYKPVSSGGWNTGVLKQHRQVAGYVGQKFTSRLKDGVLFAVQDMGRGKVVYLADNVLFRNFWSNGMLMFANAVFMVGNN